jgi:hypothetical protein
MFISPLYTRLHRNLWELISPFLCWDTAEREVYNAAERAEKKAHTREKVLHYML